MERLRNEKKELRDFEKNMDNELVSIKLFLMIYSQVLKS